MYIYRYIYFVVFIERYWYIHIHMCVYIYIYMFILLFYFVHYKYDEEYQDDSTNEFFRCHVLLLPQLQLRVSSLARSWVRLLPCGPAAWMTAVGFGPTQLALVELESTPFDHSGRLSYLLMEVADSHSQQVSRLPVSQMLSQPKSAPRHTRHATQGTQHSTHNTAQAPHLSQQSASAAQNTPHSTHNAAPSQARPQHGHAEASRAARRRTRPSEATHAATQQTKPPPGQATHPPTHTWVQEHRPGIPDVEPQARQHIWANPSSWLCGPMDKASAYGAGDCRFESCQGHVWATVTAMS